ncbi:T9SS type A sorting domain-containing protein [Mangrovimonas sp. AS39]|uniref:T9SS type A sorting domain-containing protein n=1 Tax=Mangrovimonas futianensis TaxID=2895523 RepID=UPI001E2ACBB4|nr:T9SS type A sorting domain-containing protein [Mangrovimonas futianensis]MCF1191033.1 T9SS type A sorting domain-containing protein [Mangrovimonas futianensis]MCF1194728.1 T9SS type A sorting domain-containing protein [Mangrovimonas futianensis]
MKKITLLFTMLFVAMVSQAQSIVYDFNTDGDNEGWANSGAPGWDVSGGIYTLQGDGGGDFPGGYAGMNQNSDFSPELSSSEYMTVRIIAENLIMVDGAQHTTFQLGNLPTGSTSWGSAGKQDFEIPYGSGFNEYVITIPTSPNASGDISRLGLRIKSGPTISGSLKIDEIEIVAENTEPGTEVAFEFNSDGDSEGWEENSSTISVAGGNMTITPNVGENGKVIYPGTIDADSYHWMHMVYKNESSLNNQFRVQWQSPVDDYSSYKGKSYDMATSMGNFATFSVDLSQELNGGVAYWLGMTQNIQVIIRDTNNGNASSPGDFVIDRIVFSSGGTLNVEENSVLQAQIFPNPVSHGVINISGVVVDKVTLFDVTGKKVLQSNQLIDGRLDVSSVKTGIYLLAIEDIYGQRLVKRIVVK